MKDITIAGHLCLDLIPEFHRGHLTLEPGKLTSVGNMTFATGGCVANVGLSLLKLGVSAKLLGKVGADLFGDAVRRIISEQDPQAADTLNVSATDATSYTIVLNPPDVDRHFLHNPGSNDSFDIGDINLDVLKGSKIFYFGYPPLLKRFYEDEGQKLAELFRQVNALGVSTALDMTLPDPQAPSGQIDWQLFLRRVLPVTDIFVPSLPELLYMLKHPDFEACEKLPQPDTLLSEVSARLHDLGAGIVGVKLGAQGLYLNCATRQSLSRLSGLALNSEQWALREVWSPVFQVEVKGTVGAGDSTYAGFLAALLRHLPPEDCVSVACAVGACSVEGRDAVGAVLSWEDTVARMERWSRIPHQAPADWQPHPSGSYFRIKSV